jgi:WD40 repeat protein
VLRSFAGHDGGVRFVGFARASKVLVSAGTDETARLWDFPSGKERTRVTGGVVSTPALSSDGKVLASGGTDGTVFRWDLGTCKPIPSLHTHGHHGAVRAVVFAPDGRVLASGGEDGTVRLWRLSAAGSNAEAVGGEFCRIKAHQEEVTALGLGPDGKLLASGGKDGAVRLWDAATGQRIARSPGGMQPVTALAFAPGGRLLGIGRGNFLVRVYDVTRQTERQFHEPPEAVTCLAVAPDNQIMVSGNDDGTIRLWDLRGGEPIRHFRGHLRAVRFVAFSADGRTLISAGDDAVRFWELATGGDRRTLPEVEPSAVAWAVSPAGQTLAVGTAGGRVYLRPLRGEGPARTLAGHGDVVRALAFSPDGNMLASGSEDGTVLVWDVSVPVRRRPVARPRTSKELDRLWAKLASSSAMEADEAIEQLSANPAQAVPFLLERLRADRRPVDARRIQELIADLDSDRFRVRQEARDELELLGEAAAPALRRVLDDEPPLDLRREVQRLLDRASGDPPPERRRIIRAIEVLEQTGTPEARAALAFLAGQRERAVVAKQAKASLERLVRRSRCSP